MKRMVAWLVVASMGLGVMACGAQGEETSVEEASGAIAAANGPKCGGRSTPPATSAPTLESHIGEKASDVVKLTADPASMPVGTMNPKYLTSLQLKGNGKFSAALSDGTKTTRMKGTYTIAAPRCMGANFELLSLDPAGEEAEGLMFKVLRGNNVPANSYGFVADGFTPFNMQLDGQEAPVADGCSDPSTDCASLPRPRCMGQYQCLSENGGPKECTWVSLPPPVGGAPALGRCGP